MQILAAILLDSLFGDPKGVPHPVIYVGKIISFWEKLLYSAKGRINGVLFCAAVLISTGAAVLLITSAAKAVNEYLFHVVNIYLLYAAIAFRSLHDESMPVCRALLSDDIEGARKSLACIVGRDTKNLDEDGIVRASVETIAESYIDGVFTVLFYMVIGSFAGYAAAAAWVYKAANTMDSMVGYDDDKYRNFGWAAAKFDDVLNFIPARIGALLALAAGKAAGFDGRNGLRIFLRDRLNHKSPNSAHAESAYAGMLHIALGGGAFYDGEFETRPWLGDDDREPEAEDIVRANKILTYSVAICAVIIFLARRSL